MKDKFLLLIRCALFVTIIGMMVVGCANPILFLFDGHTNYTVEIGDQWENIFESPNYKVDVKRIGGECDKNMKTKAIYGTYLSNSQINANYDTTYDRQSGYDSKNDYLNMEFFYEFDITFYFTQEHLEANPGYVLNDMQMLLVNKNTYQKILTNKFNIADGTNKKLMVTSHNFPITSLYDESTEIEIYLAKESVFKTEWNPQKYDNLYLIKSKAIIIKAQLPNGISDANSIPIPMNGWNNQQGWNEDMSVVAWPFEVDTYSNKDKPFIGRDFHGFRRPYNTSPFHYGADMWAFDFNRISTSGDEDLDSTVDSVCQGEVIYAGNGYGNYVVIRGKDGPSGLYYDYAVLYAHLNTINQDLLNDFIASGGYHYYVDIGDNIGKMGESG